MIPGWKIANCTAFNPAAKASMAAVAITPVIMQPDAQIEAQVFQEFSRCASAIELPLD
jgi:hypothetical protein